jgi:hypothetical protein
MIDTTNGKNNTTSRSRGVKALTLEETLQEIKQRRLILTYGRSGRPRPVRQAVTEHNRELHKLIMRSDVRTCAAPDLHRASWDYHNRRYCCDQCAKLLPEVG